MANPAADGVQYWTLLRNVLAAPHDEHRFLERQHIWERVHVDDYPCGACALYEFREIGIYSVKIVGRGNPINRKVKDVIFLRNLIDRLEKEKLPALEFRKIARQLYEKSYMRQCRMCMCYYPEVMENTV